ncbi:hypothetical protein QLL95_gp0009 [Cotonvirus japonicus]|uniref:Uncharacterized protein n=1 Tax=Cotonvirus japonicus TaxID=2811091 RepID=A0ABM7NQQ8_9VIRU|nr:hypothetical protein QLL95_gp0009 [Cotonvirus japonicus]BCS82498.1 hypothetical protein [Cotonvirus japonicus]
MENIKLRFNDEYRFPQGSVRKTIFPTTAYKQLKCCRNNYCLKSIATLTIPSGSTVVRAKFSDKLRTDKVYVERIEYFLDDDPIDEDNYQCTGPIYPGIQYKTGSVIEPNKEPLNTDINSTCEPGIHFFLDKNKARRF